VIVVSPTGFENRPLACEFGNHDGCPHRRASEINFFRRGDHARTVRLCRCECHTNCPLAIKDRVTHQVWTDTCTCPGASELREVEANLEEISQQDAAAYRDAVSAVIGRTTPETDVRQVRADLATELSRRGVTMSDWAMDWHSRRIVAAHRNDRLSAVRLGVDALKHGAGVIRGSIRDVRAERD
jgi:hypothetical protein